MNLTLDRYTENPIIDELVFWPPKQNRILSLRACCAMFRKPFIEISIEGCEVFQRHFGTDSFARYWAEASVFLEAITSIKLISDFSFEPIGDPGKFVREVLANRAECIDESNLMFDQGRYQRFLLQYGEDCKNLPADAVQKIACAGEQLGIGR